MLSTSNKAIEFKALAIGTIITDEALDHTAIYLKVASDMIALIAPSYDNSIIITYVSSIDKEFLEVLK
jgi:hypothetical protein